MLCIENIVGIAKERLNLMEKVLSKLEAYLLYVFVFVFFFTTLAISPNPYVVPKLALIVYLLGALVLVRIIKVVVTGKLELKVSHYDFPILVILAAYLLSTFLATPNKMEAFLLPGTTTTIVGGVLVYFFLNQLKNEERTTVSIVLVTSLAVYFVFTLLAFSGLLAGIPQIAAYMRAQSFSPEGGYLPSLLLALGVLPLATGLILTEKQTYKKLLIISSSVIIVLGLLISVYNILPGRPFAPRFPSFGVSWNIAVDSLKENPILGAGPGNYLTAFSRFRTIAYNQTDIWAIKFATSRSFYLTVITETGLLGLAALVMLGLAIYKISKQDFKERKLVNWGFAGVATLVSFLILALALVFFPATTGVIILFFILLSLIAKTKSSALHLATRSTEENQNIVISKAPALILVLPFVIVLGFSLYHASRMFVAEYYFQKALSALSKNDAAETYRNIRSAIQTNPNVDRYRTTSSQINLALVNSIARKEEVTDQDRTNITNLIQQSIAEAKFAVALNRFRSNNWEILGGIYRSIIPIAKGADGFAVQAYRQAIALDPLNPNLRINLGGIYYAAQDYETAARVFEIAVAAKPDHANSHYNLAFAYQQLGKLDDAINQMSLAISLIDNKESNDYKAAAKALEDMQAKKAEVSPEAGDSLTSPEGEQEAALEPQIDLPEGTEPPESVLTPTPTPQESEEEVVSTTPTLSPSPSPTPAQ